MKKILGTLLLFLALALVHNVKAAEAGSMSLAPSKVTVGPGKTFTVTVRMNSGSDPVNAVQANLSYPADKIDFVSISSGGTAFGIDAPSTGGGGNVSISRGTISPVSGNKTVANVTFRAKASSGTASINFAGGSAIVRSTDQANLYGGGSGTTVTFSNQTPAPTKAPKNSTQPAAAETTTSTDAFKISDVNVTQPELKKAVITWTTDVSSSSTVDYGLTNKYGATVEGNANTTGHVVTIVSELLVPGVTYHYRVKSKDAEGNEVVSADKTFVAKGYQVKINVKDKSGNPLKFVPVILNSDPVIGKTDKDGNVTFTDVEAGKHVVQVKDQGGDKVVGSTTIDVKEDPTKVQDYSIPVDTKVSFADIWASLDWNIIIAGFSAVGLIVLGVVGMKLRKMPTRMA